MLSRFNFNFFDWFILHSNLSHVPFSRFLLFNFNHFNFFYFFGLLFFLFVICFRRWDVESCSEHFFKVIALHWHIIGVKVIFRFVNTWVSIDLISRLSSLSKRWNIPKLITLKERFIIFLCSKLRFVIFLCICLILLLAWGVFVKYWI